MSPEWAFDFDYDKDESIYMKFGSCSEQQIGVPDIFDGMTDADLNEYNARFNNALRKCPFDSLEVAKADDRHMTRVECKTCQAGICTPFGDDEYDALKCDKNRHPLSSRGTIANWGLA